MTLNGSRVSVDTPNGRISLTPSRTRENGISLSMNGVTQSYTDLDDPAYMHLAFLQRLAKEVDANIPQSGHSRIIHIGGGALALPRRIAAMYPESHQTVFEPNADLLTLLLEHVDVPESVRIEQEFGELGIKKLAEGRADIIVMDAFVGVRIPPALLTTEFFRDVHRALKPGGILIINVTEPSPSERVNHQVRELGRGIFDEVFVSSGSRSVVEETGGGNVILGMRRSRLS